MQVLENNNPEKYWENHTFDDSEILENSEFNKYLDFVSAPKTDRNIEMLSRIPSRGGWSEVAHSMEVDHGCDVSPGTVQHRANYSQQRDILDDNRDWTPIAKDAIEAYKFHKDNYEGVAEFNELVAASKSKGAIKMLASYEEGKEFAVDKMRDDLDLHYSYLSQTALPNMQEAGLIEIDEISVDGEGQTVQPYGRVKEFMGSMEAVVRNHTGSVELEYNELDA